MRRAFVSIKRRNSRLDNANGGPDGFSLQELRWLFSIRRAKRSGSRKTDRTRSQSKLRRLSQILSCLLRPSSDRIHGTGLDQDVRGIPRVLGNGEMVLLLHAAMWARCTWKLCIVNSHLVYIMLCCAVVIIRHCPVRPLHAPVSPFQLISWPDVVLDLLTL